MKRRVFITALLTAPIARAADPPHVLLVGDSLAYQLGPRLKKALEPERLAYDGRGGSSAKQWLKLGWFRRALLRQESPVVLVSLGVNCTSSERPALKEHVRELRQLAEGRRCIWLLPPPLRFSTEYLRAAVSGEAFDPGVLQMESDGIHPTDAGHRKWARLIVEYLKARE